MASIQAFPTRARRMVPAGLIIVAAPFAHAQCNGPSITQQPVGGTIHPGETIVLSVEAGGTGPLAFQWRRNNQPLVDGGQLSGATTASLTITGADLSDSRSYDVQITNACGTILSSGASVIVRWSACFANCDGSTTPPCLNVADFICFLNRFAARDPYTYCDGSIIPHGISINDFACFLNKFASGCSDC